MNLPTYIRPLTVLAGGILGMLVAMSIGRFAYTLLLPLMLHDHPFGPSVAGWIAGANFFGYFVGSLTATAWPRERSTRAPLYVAFIASTLSTAAMGFTTSPTAWFVLRLISGIASAWVFVFISALVLTELASAGIERFTGWIFGGVGVGIAITALLALVWPGHDSDSLWLAFGIVSAGLTLASAILLSVQRAPLAVTPRKVESAGTRRDNTRALLLFAYSLEGIGYVVSATFIVAVINTAQGRFEAGALAWMVVGFAGIPACVLWTRRADYRGLLNRLATGYWIQFTGIVLVAIWPDSVTAAFVSAASLGATLVGIVMLTIGLAPRIDPQNPRKIVGQLTIGFSLGQMLGPVLAGYAADHFGSFRVPLLASAALVALSGVATHVMIAAERRVGAGATTA